MKVTHEVWNVRISFSRDGRRGNWESGVNTGWPKGTSAMDVIADVIKWREIDPKTIVSIDATKYEEEYELAHGAAPTSTTQGDTPRQRP